MEGTIQIVVNSYMLRCALGSIIVEEYGNINMIDKIVSQQQIIGIIEKSTGCIVVEEDILKLLPEDYLVPKMVDIVAVTLNKPKQNPFSFAKQVIHISDSKSEIIKKLDIVIHADTIENNPDNTLSEREREIIKFVAKGLTNKEIADILFISIHTVITHRKNITAKLGIKTISGLSIYALLNGIIQSDEAKL